VDRALNEAIIEDSAAGLRILVDQVETAIRMAPSPNHAFELMPVSLVCWYLGHLVVELRSLEAMQGEGIDPPASARSRAVAIAHTMNYLRGAATLNTRTNPELAEHALACVDAYTDEMIARLKYPAMARVDLTYGGVIPAPAE
jgi:hypothetical protein